MHPLERTSCPFLTERDPEPRDVDGTSSSEAEPVGGSSPKGTRYTVASPPYATSIADASRGTDSTQRG